MSSEHSSEQSMLEASTSQNTYQLSKPIHFLRDATKPDDMCCDSVASNMILMNAEAGQSKKIELTQTV